MFIPIMPFLQDFIKIVRLPFGHFEREWVKSAFRVVLCVDVSMRRRGSVSQSEERCEKGAG